MRAARILIAALLAATGLVAAGTTSATAATGSKSLTVQYGGKVIKNEQFDVSGQVTTRYERQIKLQYKSGSSWKTLMSATVNADDGRFRFDNVTTTKSRYFRYYAPASEGNGDESGKKIVGSSKKVTVVSQTASGKVTPYPATYFFFITDHFEGEVYADLSFSPAREGREVTFTTPNGASASGYQDSRGNVIVPFDLNKSSGTYSITATASANSGAAAKSTSAIPVKVESRGFFFLEFQKANQ